MSYPRNAASPPRISVGIVVQISDGAVQTSGVSIAIQVEGGSETAGSGTISYGSLTNIVYYTPTQAETDYTGFTIVAYKSGCYPAEKHVITSASNTSGYSAPDWSKVGNPTTTVGLTGTTISTSQAVASVTGAVGSVTGNVGGNVVGSVGSISGVTFPTNFSAMSITVGGIVKADLDTIKTQTVTCAASVTVGVYVGGTGAAALETSMQTLTTTVGAAGVGLTEAGGNGDHLTAIPWNANWDAEVQSEVNDALIAYDVATGTEVAGIDAKIGTPAVTVSDDIAAVLADTTLIKIDTGTTIPGQLTLLINQYPLEIL